MTDLKIELIREAGKYAVIDQDTGREVERFLNLTDAEQYVIEEGE